LIRLHHGVFKLGSTKPNLDQLEMAAILAAGQGAVLSHASAARRLGLDVPAIDSVQVTIPASRVAPKLTGVRVSRSRELTERDVTRRGPFRLTHLARTMIDLASVLDAGWLRATLDSALRQKQTNFAWISRALNNDGRGRRGAKRLRTLLTEHRLQDEIPDSALESLAMELARATGRKPRLHWNIVERGRLIAEVDFAWPEVRLCVELDGWAEHGTRAAFVHDRLRDRTLLKLGWMVLRYTWYDVIGDGESLVSELVSTYESRALFFASEAGTAAPAPAAAKPQPLPSSLIATRLKPNSAPASGLPSEG
jgi:very-short-patch-repair endonuclease